jgi:hypothetical protein
VSFMDSIFLQSDGASIRPSTVHECCAHGRDSSCQPTTIRTMGHARRAGLQKRTQLGAHDPQVQQGEHKHRSDSDGQPPKSLGEYPIRHRSDTSCSTGVSPKPAMGQLGDSALTARPVVRTVCAEVHSRPEVRPADAHRLARRNGLQAPPRTAPHRTGSQERRASSEHVGVLPLTAAQRSTSA